MNHLKKFKTAITLAGMLALLVLPARADTFGSGANTFTIDFVTVGDPDNVADSGTTGSYSSLYGGVGSTFRMGVYEISRDMVSKANTGGALGLTLWDMTSFGGNVGTHPATGISWNEAARFINWLNTSQGYSVAYKFNLQPGNGGYDPNAYLVLWTSGDAGYNPSNLYRNSNAHYFLPSEDEWYKAAYYSGSGNTYYDYATQQDAPTAPTSVANGTASGTAVYGQSSSQGPADIDQSGGLSHYGTMGQSGNVYEWQESDFGGVNRGPDNGRVYRGGIWPDSENVMRSSFRPAANPTFSIDGVGFRVASVPEPSSTLLMIGTSLMWVIKRRRAVNGRQETPSR